VPASSPVLAVPPMALAALRARIDAFLVGAEPLTGLDLYFLLERATSLVEFHTMLRLGPQNRTRSGLQQSYGDHNRLLQLGLDRLEEGDLEWYRSRLEQSGEISDGELLDCFAAIRALGLTAPQRVAMWLAAALHDCGMLAGHGLGIDVEDGVELGRGMMSALCPGELQELALFVVRNHDYIKDVFLGEVPTSFIGDQVERLAPSLRDAALAGLGMVQVAGAASLGDGRLSRFRLEIFHRCFDRRVLADRSAGTRLARLLEPQQLDVPQAISLRWEAAIEDPPGGATSLRRFLERIPVHGWHRRWVGSGASVRDGFCVIGSIAERFGADFADHHHVVIGKVVDLGFTSASGSGWRLPACTTVEFANGTAAMVVGA
jgi:hypothetical protein